MNTQARNTPVAFLWDTFAAATLPPDCSDVQRDEMQKAFFAGAIGLFMQLQQALHDGPGASPAEVMFMQDLIAEVTAFQEQARQTAIESIFKGLGLEAKFTPDKN